MKKKIVLIGYTCATRKSIEKEFDAQICPPSARYNGGCTPEDMAKCRKIRVVIREGWKK